MYICGGTAWGMLTGKGRCSMQVIISERVRGVHKDMGHKLMLPLPLPTQIVILTGNY